MEYLGERAHDHLFRFGRNSGSALNKPLSENRCRIRVCCFVLVLHQNEQMWKNAVKEDSLWSRCVKCRSKQLNRNRRRSKPHHLRDVTDVEGDLNKSPVAPGCEPLATVTIGILQTNQHLTKKPNGHTSSITKLHYSCHKMLHILH